MRIKRSILIIAPLLLLLGVVAWLLLRPRPQEPVYQGKTLSQWLQRVDVWYSTSPVAAEPALLIMGTNAVPFLIADLRAREFPLEKKLYPFLARHSLLPSDFRLASYRRYRALKALPFLGPLAKPAIPALADCLDRPENALDAVNALSHDDPGGKPSLAPEATPAFLKALTNSTPQIRSIAANYLGLSQCYPEIVVPALIRALKDPDPEVRRMAASSFGGIYKKESATVVPALIETLDDPDSGVRKWTVRRLGHHGPSAKAAIPKLIKLLKDAPSDLEKEINTALKAIDPAAAQAVTK